MKLNLPNQLTVLRMCLVPIFVIFFLFSSNYDSVLLRLIPLVIFVFAALTDAFDGHIARRDNLITDFGKFMDPLADKLLVTSAMICFVELGYLSSWIVILIIAREFIISGFRMLASSKGITIAANIWGKIKTISQMILIILILFDFANFFEVFNFLIGPLTVITVLLTIISAASYVYDNKKVIGSF